MQRNIAQYYLKIAKGIFIRELLPGRVAGASKAEGKAYFYAKA